MKRMHPKTDYLELLLENPDGLTTTEIEELFFEDTTRRANSMALKRLHRQGCVRREREGFEYRYWITEKGMRKYYYLTEGT